MQRKYFLVLVLYQSIFYVSYKPTYHTSQTCTLPSELLSPHIKLCHFHGIVARRMGIFGSDVGPLFPPLLFRSKKHIMAESYIPSNCSILPFCPSKSPIVPPNLTMAFLVTANAHLRSVSHRARCFAKDVSSLGIIITVPLGDMRRM